MKKNENQNINQLACLDKHLSRVGFGCVPIKVQMHNNKIVKVFGKKIFKKTFAKKVGASEAGLRILSFLKKCDEERDSGEISFKFCLTKGKVDGVLIESELELDFDSLV